MTYETAVCIKSACRNITSTKACSTAKAHAWLLTISFRKVVYFNSVWLNLLGNLQTPVLCQKLCFQKLEDTYKI
jgi:hypothetical protein